MEIKTLLIDSAKNINIDINDKEADNFIKYKDLLIEWNEKINLTAITEENEIIIKHFIDSITPMSYREFKGKNVIDVGTGAGFPGLPIKIACEDINLTLMDSLNKRVKFLNDVIEKLELKNIETFHARAEEGGKDKQFREKYDYCVSRAVAALNILSEYCLPFVKVGGEFIALKGSNIKEEIEESKKAIEVLGGKITEIKEITLPNTDIKHSIIFIKKIKQTPTKYPRNSKNMSKGPII